MYIIGTSGHIDHGKTSLIRALTGIDCDRLPEEKEREMTIDIGFAMIEYPRFGTVSIIDVPGHERFIRNMVVGAWGVDLGLLVIAADDGWMPQTEDHFRVFDLLGTEKIIVVLNKTDLADEETAVMAEEEIRERLRGSRFEKSDMLRVSAKTGAGIEDLKKAILENLKKLSKTPDSSKPYLFVDRYFSSKGYGTVITGTLKNGRFQENDSVILLPQKKEVRIKKIESHFKEAREGSPSQRTALNLSGVPMEVLDRGSIIVKNNFFTESGDILAKIKLVHQDRKIRNNIGIELLVGTTKVKGKLILINEPDKDSSEFPARIKLNGSWFFYPGEPFIITMPGGYRIIGGGKILLPEYSSIKRAVLKEKLGIFKDYTLEEIIEFIINIKQGIRLQDINSMFPEDEKFLNRVISKLEEGEGILNAGDFLLDKDFYKSALSIIDEAIKSNAGLNLKEISDLSLIDQELCRILLPKIQEGSPIVEKDGRYFSGESITLDTLPEEKKELLSRVHSKKDEGMELDRLDDEALKARIKELVRLGFLVTLDGNIVYHIDVYENLKKKILLLFDNNDKIVITEAKDATGLSRKYIIPLLNRIEGEGLIRRIGEFRMKV